MYGFKKLTTVSLNENTDRGVLSNVKLSQCNPLIFIQSSNSSLSRWLEGRLWCSRNRISNYYARMSSWDIEFTFPVLSCYPVYQSVCAIMPLIVMPNMSGLTMSKRIGKSTKIWDQASSPFLFSQAWKNDLRPFIPKALALDLNSIYQSSTIRSIIWTH